MNPELLDELVKNLDVYEAHTYGEKGAQTLSREKLLEHTKLTYEYFQYLWREKETSGMLERFINRMFGGLTQEGQEYLMEMIEGIPVFHDIGKVNPLFQKFQMKNKNAPQNCDFERIGQGHSMISAVLYIDYFRDRLMEDVLDKPDRERLRPFILYHAYLIERHHSDLTSFEKFLDSLLNGLGSTVVDVLEKNAPKIYKRLFKCSHKMLNRAAMASKETMETFTGDRNILFYGYEKILYSLLVASDYYATAQFMSGTKIHQVGNLNDISRWIDIFEETEVMRGVRKYQKHYFPQKEFDLRTAKDINILRNEMLLEAEQEMNGQLEKSLFYLEGPTGSGKSNTAFYLSFQLMRWDKRLKKIWYIYPFNTLVEQNLENLEKVFERHPEVGQGIAVVNSLAPIKMTRSEKELEEEFESGQCYQKALLNRQFLNYPVILSTHVSLFDTMFGDTKESSFGFHQLMNSVVVLDEIQSYRNEIWGEIICFLKGFAYLLNMKVIIMSATLPNLDMLSGEMDSAVVLLKNREKYFANDLFRKRVKLSYELLGRENIEEVLVEHIRGKAAAGKRILVEFIKKNSASSFFQRLKQEDICEVEYMSGDDSLIERKRILRRVRQERGPFVLVATQVVEAGVDIDMEVGYKNISKLDSEEQFLGRINRSCLGCGEVYFFQMDDSRTIYKKDIRVQKEFTVENRKMQDILMTKDFSKYYAEILAVIKKNYNDSVNEEGLEYFFKMCVGKLDWLAVRERMKLIEEDQWGMQVYLARTLDEEEKAIDGVSLWYEYVDMLQNFSIGYAKKKIRLSEITSKMNYFIYQIRKNSDLIYNERVGDIFFIEDGEKYFTEGKLDRKKVQGEIGEFVDFL